MPIKFHYDPQIKVLMARYEGLISLAEMQESFMLLIGDPDIPSHANALWDVSDMEFNNITIDFQREVIEMRRQHAARRKPAKVAILCTYILAEPLVKMYTILSKELGEDARLFMHESEALAWLAE